MSWVAKSIVFTDSATRRVGYVSSNLVDLGKPQVAAWLTLRVPSRRHLEDILVSVSPVLCAVLYAWLQMMTILFVHLLQTRNFIRVSNLT